MAQGFFRRRHWRAVDQARNIARDYRLDASVDLFGRIVIEQRWGRVGCRGCDKIFSFDTIAAATRHIERVEARRATSPQRLKVYYVDVRKT